MNKFTVRPNKSVSDIIDCQGNRVKVEISSEGKSPFFASLDDRLLGLGYQYYEGRLRSPTYIQNAVMSNLKIT